MHVCYKSVGVARHSILNVLSAVNRMRSLGSVAMATVVAVWCSKAEQAASVRSARFSSLLQMVDITGMRCKRGIAGTTVLSPGSCRLCCS